MPDDAISQLQRMKKTSGGGGRAKALQQLMSAQQSMPDDTGEGSYGGGGQAPIQSQRSGDNLPGSQGEPAYTQPMLRERAYRGGANQDALRRRGDSPGGEAEYQKGNHPPEDIVDEPGGKSDEADLESMHQQVFGQGKPKSRGRTGHNFDDNPTDKATRQDKQYMSNNPTDAVLNDFATQFGYEQMPHSRDEQRVRGPGFGRKGAPLPRPRPEFGDADYAHGEYDYPPRETYERR